MSGKPKTTFLDAVKAAILAYDMTAPGDTVVVGVSGGPDSVALLHALNILKHDLGLKLIVAHVDHALRSNSGGDAAFVNRLAYDLGVECRIKRVDVGELSGRLGMSIEETGRKVRYEFFEELRLAFHAAKIATAHHSDDAVETFFLRLVRGSSLMGLQGIAAKRDYVIRPLIDCDRDRILDFLISNDFAYRIDESNLSSATDRNFIRNRVLPVLSERFPNYRQSLRRTMKLLNKENELLDRLTESRYVDSADETHDEIRLDLDKLFAHGAHIAARAILKALYSVSDDRTRLEEKHVTALLDLVKSGVTTFMLDLPRGITAVRQYDRLLVRRAGLYGPAGSIEESIRQPGAISLPGVGQKLTFSIKGKEAVDLTAASHNKVYFDADLVGFPLKLRNRLPGDRFRPWGGKGSRKIKEILIDLKMPRERRENVALLLSRGEIIWMVGVRRSNIAPVTERTKRVLEITLNDAEG